MDLLKTNKKLEIDKKFGNLHLATFDYAKPSTDGWENYTILSCWYEPNCEACPMGWEDIGYEGECYDCGCMLSGDGHSFDVPAWKCMLPKSIKKAACKLKMLRTSVGCRH